MDTLPLDVEIVQSGPCLNETSHGFHLAPMTNEDIKMALFSIGDDKAPRPNGYSSAFFKQSWEVVGDDFCLAIHDFFTSGEILRQINHSIIALVPKSKNVTKVSEFRPISCCNVTYKFVYCSSRNHQSCSECFPGRKAFDSVQWPFLRQLLLTLGFPDRFVNLIMKCVETTSFSVVVNGDLYGFFQGKSGVRQGDPLSPYLFITCMEYVSRMLDVASGMPGSQFHPKCKVHRICLLAFADDILLFSRGDRPSVHMLHQQLMSFGRISGLEINASKSSIYFGGVGTSSKQIILQATGFKKGSFPFKYLCVPLSPHRLLASQFYPLLHKLDSAIQSWIGKHLSYAGRLELLKSVLQEIVCNFGSAFSLYQCKSSVRLPARNTSFLAKQLWNIHQKTDTLWIQWVHHFYLSYYSIWDAGLLGTSSPLWKAIISLKDQLLQESGSHFQAITRLQSWQQGSKTFYANAYEFFREKGTIVPWERVVWEHWFLPRYSFFLRLAVKGKLRTKDRLWFTPTDTYCTFYRHGEESHRHLFFACNWTSNLWGKIKSWLRRNRHMGVGSCPTDFFVALGMLVIIEIFPSELVCLFLVWVLVSLPIVGHALLLSDSSNCWWRLAPLADIYLVSLWLNWLLTMLLISLWVLKFNLASDLCWFWWGFWGFWLLDGWWCCLWSEAFVVSFLCFPMELLFAKFTILELLLAGLRRLSQIPDFFSGVLDNLSLFALLVFIVMLS
ncbi:uncharacterized protein LOC120003593 [Tripterygium wilfordii]|uniref:uncharacterized protein LOC120003593 n=1 Tax=Tripterygium wilfordii TaxID=458696 RepID=UPI0018F844E6|nr:uncharacterized protein LOC120003593 [Tripterygium wilfordii]